MDQDGLELESLREIVQRNLLDGDVVESVLFPVSFSSGGFQGDLVGGFFVTSFLCLFTDGQSVFPVHHHTVRKVNKEKKKGKIFMKLQCKDFRDLVVSFDYDIIDIKTYLEELRSVIYKDDLRMLPAFREFSLDVQLDRIKKGKVKNKSKTIIEVSTNDSESTSKVSRRDGARSKTQTAADLPHIKRNIDLSPAETINGWEVYDPIYEYSRLGLHEEDWEISNLNQEYDLCSTYPKLLCFPSDIGEEDLRDGSKFRTRNRLPSIVWRKKQSNATISRSSQPMPGVTNKRNKKDESFLELLREKAEAEHLHILDARPSLNAHVCEIQGGGFESTKFYTNCLREFEKIENIHAVRSSANGIHKIAMSGNTQDSDTKFIDTNWPSHINSIMKASFRTASLIKEGAPVLIHCSDGWDRTAQMSAVAQVILDPRYREFKGFMCLIEKEWCSFGHQFALRNGHNETMSNYGEDQRAPIFLQFIDCIYQLLMINPDAFEFNEYFLIFILDHLHSCMFGTFLFDCEREREENGAYTETQSLWTLALKYENLFINPTYTRYKKTISSRHYDENPLFWKKYYLRWSDFPGLAPEKLKSYTLGLFTPYVGHLINRQKKQDM
eukprot:TRINITY_DN10267_c0_g1_i1.p1 TRINITY_DN10267_c0_g1~~TRINITY_DN10267_c0_g1_i1.p1  ORF type:complete len:610 (+),score=97.08 TRINITY_DN10267_c0_g1_i1:80-1909(+)